MFNLLDEAWLPVRRADGRSALICPSEITSDLEANPIVAVEWPRPDFRVACVEFLIGLIATARPPPDDEGWIDGWETPPTSAALAAAFAPIADAFNVDGSGPRFLQDTEDLPGEPDAPETLLIEAPGENTRRRNAALLVKSGRVARLSRRAAAMALFTLQCYAPSGGRGNLTSVRGGGPLTTLALPGSDPLSLWHLVWANVPPGKPPGTAELPLVFPWLAPTRTADRFPATTPAEAHPLQVFWGMPRRVRLDYAENRESLPCDLTGAVDGVIVTGWRQRPNGVKYVAWDHPLSPSRKDAKSGGWLPVHAQLGGIGYRHWVAIALGDSEGTRFPARCITDWRSRSANVPSQIRRASRLLAAGYDMDNMKARAFVESEMPLPGTHPEGADAMAFVARGLVAAAEVAAQALRVAVRDARYRFSRDISSDSTALAAIYEGFWAATQDRFFRLLNGADSLDPEAALAAVAAAWRTLLRRTALQLFDETAPLDPFAASSDPRRIVKARRNLFRILEGYGSRGGKLFDALLLPLPESKARRTRRAKAEEAV
jgi:CRISPR system Cascade subunit CasA